MKIGISGAQSVGKTTLLNALRSEKCFQNYAIRNEVTRTVKSYGIPINQDGGDVSQLLIMKEHIYNLTMFDNMITDRTVLDGIVYTRWLYENTTKISTNVFEECVDVFERMKNRYDYIFYIEPEFAIESDGVRNTDEAWQRQIVEIFNDIISGYEVPVVKITGSVRERVNTVLKTIGELND